MKKHDYSPLVFIVFIFWLSPVWSQSIGINTTNPDTSALLDLSSTSKGVLIPRMNTTQMNAISTPANGLLVYNTDSNAFCVYSSGAWSKILLQGQSYLSANGSHVYFNNAGNVGVGTNSPSAKLHVNGNFKTDSFQLTTGATNGYILSSDAAGKAAWVNPLTTTAVRFIGNSLISNYAGYGSTGNSEGTTPYRANVFLGSSTGSGNTTGYYNIGIGIAALYENTTGTHNIGLGNLAGRDNTTGSSNITIGSLSNMKNVKGEENVVLGGNALMYSDSGMRNTAVGVNSGKYNQGNHNVFIGYGSGAYETGSNKLYIDNYASSNPLIYGEFDHKMLRINDSLEAKYFQMTDGAAHGHMLQSDSSGNASWVDPLATGAIRFVGTSLIGHGSGYGGLGNSEGSMVSLDNNYLSPLSGYHNTDGSHNVSIGHLSLYKNTSGSRNVAAGRNALRENTSGLDNIALGHNSLYYNSEGNSNVSVGSKSSFSNIKGLENVAIGNEALYSNDSGVFNTAVGAYAGYNVKGTLNVMIGHSAGYNETGDHKLYIDNGVNPAPLIYGEFDHKMLRINDSLEAKFFQMTSGATNGHILSSDSNGNASWVSPLSNSTIRYVGNSILSNYAGKDGTGNQEGTTANRSNVFIGDNVGYYNTDGNLNTAIGYHSLAGNTSGFYNIGLGAYSANSNSTGWSNITLGAYSSFFNVKGSDNISIGTNSMLLNDSGNKNVSIGVEAGYNNEGSGSVFLGYGAGFQETGSNKLYISNSTTKNPLIFGDFAQKIVRINDSLETKYFQMTNGAVNGRVLMSDASGNGSWSSTTNISLLRYIGTSYISHLAGRGATGTSEGTSSNLNNIFIGLESGRDITTGQSNSAIGKYSLRRLKTGDYNMSFGTNSLSEIVSGLSNIAIGSFSLATLDSGNGNVVIGASAGGTMDAGSDNVFIGSGSGYSNKGSGNVFIGSNSGYNETGSNKLYIDNSTSSTPLIHGDFSTNALTINGNQVVSAGGAKTTAYSGAKFNNTATSSTSSIIKAGLEVVSTGTWNGTNASNIGLYISSVSGGTNNYDAIFNGGGSIGIGTNNPTKGKVEINGSVSYPTSSVSYGYLVSSGNTGTFTTGTTSPFSLYASARIGAAEFNAFSDARIKNIIGKTNNEKDLSILMNIPITEYRLIDTIEKGNKIYTKVIAQDVEQVYPRAVSRQADFIPNIYQLKEMKNGCIAMSDTSIQKGTKIKLIFGHEQVEAHVINITQAGIQTDVDRSGSVFVYGKWVDDFRSVDYEALSMLNISATQALVQDYYQIKELVKNQQKVLNQLVQEVTLLKANISTQANLDQSKP